MIQGRVTEFFNLTELTSARLIQRARTGVDDWPADFEGDVARGTSDHDPPVARFER